MHFKNFFFLIFPFPTSGWFVITIILKPFFFNFSQYFFIFGYNLKSLNCLGAKLLPFLIPKFNTPSLSKKTAFLKTLPLGFISH